MIRAVLDTNVLASRFASFKHPKRPPAQILHAWKYGLFELITSDHIITELKRTFQDPYFKKRLNKENISIGELVTLLSEDGTVVPITIKVQGIATHPEDDLTLATAISAKADYLVTGDGPLLRKVGRIYQGVKLVAPNDFLEILQKQS